MQLRVCVDNSLWLRRPQHRISWSFDVHARGSRQQSRSTASRCPMTGTAGPQQALKEPGSLAQQAQALLGRHRRRQARVGTHHPPAVCTDSRVGDGVNERPGYIVKPARGFELFFFGIFTGLLCAHRRIHRSRSTPSIHGDVLPPSGNDAQSASAA